MIVWSGKGILVVVYAFCGAFIGQAVGQSVLHWQNAGPLVGLGLILVAAPLVWRHGQALNKKAAGRVLIDPTTGQQVILRARHSLFWINMEYWAVVLIVIGLCGMLGILHLDMRPTG